MSKGGEFTCYNNSTQEMKSSNNTFSLMDSKPMSKLSVLNKEDTKSTAPFKQ
uniref:Uncharacterized protein n=1 Tax=Anguilla anguilla TaxID=7936 RepID=A0A0E9UVF7_ANGAN